MGLSDVVLGLERQLLKHVIRLEFYDLNQTDELCKELSNKVEESDFNPDVVIGVLDKGFYPAYKMSEYLKLPLEFVHVSRPKHEVMGFKLYNSAVATKILSPFYKESKPSLKEEFNPSGITGLNVLLIDEDCSSGETFSVAENVVKDFNPNEIRTGTIYRFKDHHAPDFYVDEITLLNNPIVKFKIRFPWYFHSPDYEAVRSLMDSYLNNNLK